MHSTWIVKWDPRAIKDLKRLSSDAAKDVYHFLESKIHEKENPRSYGEPLKGDKSGLWRYRVGDYRIICKLSSENLTILVVRVGHRKSVYSS